VTLSGTASNAATSGGFGPNQVSTALGLGIFAIVVRLFMKSPTIFLKVLNLLILGGMAFRAIVTFSRGGIYSAIIISFAFLVIVFYRSSTQKKINIALTFIVFAFAISATWVISSNQTRGLIDKRYANEDSLGRDKGDITTGRLELFKEEMEGFLSSPFFGVGESRIKDIRVEEHGIKVPSHNEIGRLLSEHGILGIIILLILVIKPLVYRANNKKSFYFYAFLGFWFATINHSGMRIAAPAFLYALCLLNITNEKSPVHRKQITE
jgi:O-antigen ligase